MMWKPFNREPLDDDKNQNDLVDPEPREDEEEEPELPELPDLEVGMYLEVLTNQNRLLFRGRITEVSAFSDAIRIEDAEGGTLPYVEYNSRVKLRGFSNGQAICIMGMIGGSTKTFWKVDRLGTLQTSERRDYFRQNISLEVEVLRIEDLPEFVGGETEAETAVTATDGQYPISHAEPVHADSTGTSAHTPTPEELSRCAVTCRMLDVSAGGCMLFSKSILRVGERVELHNIVLLPGEEAFSFRGVIRRAIKREDLWEYGCEFQEQDSKQQERLIRLILLLQRKELRARRGIF